nr:cation:proton antiporter [bacterium]
MNILLSLAAAMAAGLALTRVMKWVRLPNVTGYLIAGVLVGPYCLNWVGGDNLQALDVITAVALGFIAFSIGNEFKWKHIKEIGGKAITITVFQALMALALVDAVLLIAGCDAPMALTLGAIATATAPAATLMVVRQYKADGPVTRTLLPVVAMDDALGLMAFSISMAIARSLSSQAAVSVGMLILEPIREIVLSLVVGAALGALLALLMRFFASRANRLCLMITMVIAGVALSGVWNLSSLLVCMMIGAAFINLRQDGEAVLEGADRWTPPLFMLFFVISGAELELSVVPTVGLFGVLYLIARSLGKYGGASIGSAMVHAHPNITKYLGVALLPQAGVAIGMAQMAMISLPEYGSRIRAIVLCATLIYELVGPVLTKIALTRAGEIARPSKKPRLKKA